MYFSGEWRKLSGTGLYTVLLLFVVIPVVFQGTLGLLAGIEPKNMHITTLDLFSRVFVVLSAGALVSMSFFSEYRKNALVNTYLHGIPVFRLLLHKWLYVATGVCLLVLTGLIGAGLFVHLAGGHLLDVFRSVYLSVLFLFVGALCVANMHYLLCLLLKEHTLLSLMVAFAGAIGNFWIPSTRYWIAFPWSYPLRALYFSSLSVGQLVFVAGVALVSSLLVAGLIFSASREPHRFAGLS